MKKLLTVLIAVLVLLNVQLFLSTDNLCSLIVYADGTPDSYGNRIVGLWVEEWNDTLGDYQSPYGQCKKLVTYDGTNTFDGLTIHSNGASMDIIAYTANVELKVYDNRALKVIVKCAGNKTLLSDPTTEMRAYINITGVVTNQQMTYDSHESGSNFYVVKYYYVWNSTGEPTAGTDYTVKVWYEAYY